jgi:hypothetical protein
LGVFAGEQHFTEIIVLDGLFFNIPDKTGHCICLLDRSEKGFSRLSAKNIVAQTPIG